MPPRDPLSDPEPLVRRIYAFVAYRIGDGPDAEDVTSATFERAVRLRNDYDPHLGEPIAWLAGIARRCVAEHPAGGAANSEPAEGWPRRPGVEQAVAGLSERDRELVALRYGAELTTRQVGDVLGLRTSAVAVALKGALAALRATAETHR